MLSKLRKVPEKYFFFIFTLSGIMKETIFNLSICNGCGMPAGYAYPSGHLVPSPIVGLACAPIVETRFLDLAMSLLEFSPRIPLGTCSILLKAKKTEKGILVIYHLYDTLVIVNVPKYSVFLFINSASFSTYDHYAQLRISNKIDLKTKPQTNEHKDIYKMSFPSRLHIG